LRQWLALGQVNPAFARRKNKVFIGNRERPPELDGATGGRGHLA
jgi:hypothetical protein